MRIVRSTVALGLMAASARAQSFASLASSLASNGGASVINGVLGGSGSPDIANVVNAMTNGYELSTQIPECQASIAGEEVTINDAYSALEPALTNSGNQEAAASFAMAAFKAYSGSTSSEIMLYKLYQIYQDEEASIDSDTLSAAQETAYDTLTPECVDAFDSITEAYEAGAEVVGASPGAALNVTCNTYMSMDKTATMGLCVFPPKMQTAGNTAQANLTAVFTNYGVPVCNVSFFIRNIAANSQLNPTWLPVTKRAYPNGVPTNTEINMNAVVAWSQEMAAPGVYTIWDILPGWSACPAGTTPQSTPAATTAATSKATTPAYNGIIAAQASCFQTSACKSAVSGMGMGSECSQYAALFQSGCHKCGSSVMEVARTQCLAFCSEDECSLTAKSADGSTSPAGRTVASAVVMGAAAVAAAAALL